MDYNYELFKDYAQKYAFLGDSITLKVDHTFRVVKLCEEIAKSLDLSDEDVELAKTCGLLNDIGRFEQWKQYHTFRDRESIDHGNLGYDLLTEDDYIKQYNYNDVDERIILNTVLFHNKFKLPGDLDERDALFTKITRDADKLDILFSNANENTIIDIKNSVISDEIMDSLRNNLDADKGLFKTPADQLSVPLGFPFDLNFPISINIIKENNYINKMIDFYKKKTTNRKTKKQLEEIRSIIDDYLEKRLADVE